MRVQDRRQQIIDLLMNVGQASLDDMATQFSVSRMTIYRDLTKLESDGLLRKIRGGATVKSSSQFESEYTYRKRIRWQEKRAIAKAAAAYAEPGQTIILDDSTTVSAISDLLTRKSSVSIITNSFPIIWELSEANNVNLVALGGEYIRRLQSFIGIVTEQAIRSLRVDVAFISTSSVRGATAYHQYQEIVMTKRAMIDVAERKYLLVDHTKFERTALHFLTPLSEFDAVITDSHPPPEIAEAMKNESVNLEIAGEDSRSQRS